MKYKIFEGVYSPVRKWKPTDYRLERLAIIGLLMLLVLGIFLLAPLSEAEQQHCMATVTDKSICK